MTIIVRRSDIFGAAGRLYNRIKAQVTGRISAFCNRKVIEQGLAAKTFEFDFSFFGGDTQEVTARRKSIGKLKQLLMKHVNKVIPTSIFATAPILDTFNRDDLIFTSKSLPIQVDLRNISHDAWPRELRPNRVEVFLNAKDLVALPTGLLNLSKAVIRKHIDPRYKWAERYCAKLNANFRKHNISVVAEVQDHMAYNPTVDTANPHILTVDTLCVSIVFRLRKWVPASAERWVQVTTNQTEAGDYFYNQSNWLAYPVGSNTLGQESLSTPEALFFHLDKITKVLITLSRKAHYETGAYTFKRV